MLRRLAQDTSIATMLGAHNEGSGREHTCVQLTGLNFPIVANNIAADGLCFSEHVLLLELVVFL